ncbi:MAG: hypothetical protein ACREQQ_14460, partial [Candidatus Binatia bacterium]
GLHGRGRGRAGNRTRGTIPRVKGGGMSQARSASGAISVRTAGIVFAVVLVTVFGWHLAATRSIDDAARDFVTGKLPGVKEADVEVDPVTNVVSVRLATGARTSGEDPLSALGQALSSALGTAIASAFEPALERELNLRARERLDLYAMVLPYRVRIVEGTGED